MGSDANLSDIVQSAGEYIFYVIDNESIGVSYDCTNIDSAISNGDVTLLKKKEVNFVNNRISVSAKDKTITAEYDATHPRLQIENISDEQSNISSDVLGINCRELEADGANHAKDQMNYDESDTSAGDAYTLSVYLKGNQSCNVNATRASYSGEVPVNKLVIKYS